MTRRSTLADERGVATVMVALAIPLFLLVCVFAVDVANWFVHKRHLQTQADAAALAGAGMFTFPACDNDLIRNTALRYSGKGDGTFTFNDPAEVKTDQSRLFAEINEPDFYNQSKPGETDLPAEPCDSKIVDVKMTETDLPWFFGTGLVPNINAEARVQLFQVSESEKLLPVGVQEVEPRKVRAYVVDETTGIEIDGVNLADAGNTGNVANFDNEAAPLTFSVPSTTSRLGVRIALSGRTDGSTTCGQPLVNCYDSVATTNGLSFIRTWNALPDPLPSGAVPQARSVFLSPDSCANASFNADATSCTFNVGARVKWNPLVTLADLDPATSKTKLTAKFNGVTRAMTYSVATATWTTSTPFTQPAGTIGPRGIDIDWVQQTGTISGTTCKVNGNPKECKGTFANVQRTFWNDPSIQDSRGGPLSRLDVLDSATLQQVSDLQQCSATHPTCQASLIFDVGIKGSLKLAAIGDPPVALRRDENQSQSLQCDPAEGGSAGLQNTIANGCKPRYRVNTGEACGAKNDVWAVANPPGSWACVALLTGVPPNTTPRGLNQRILCNPALGEESNCTGNASAVTCNHPNNWPNFTLDDPRIVGVFLTPFGTFTGTGTETVPVIGFASFYITGYTNEGGGVNTPCADITGPGADSYAINPPPEGHIAGHYFKSVNPNTGGAGTEECDFASVNQCVAVLVK